MHRIIVGEDSGLIDHKNGNGLDNRRENLRIVTHCQNSSNTSRHREGLVAGFTRYGKKFHARITINCEVVQLGKFANEAEASAAYAAGVRIRTWLYDKAEVKA